VKCSCPVSMRRIYYASIQLYPDLKDGVMSGRSLPRSTKVVNVCAECGTAEFSIDESELRWFRNEQSNRAQ
jgi:hypothetical protein